MKLDSDSGTAAVVLVFDEQYSIQNSFEGRTGYSVRQSVVEACPFVVLQFQQRMMVLPLVEVAAAVVLAGLVEEELVVVP